MPYVLCTRHVLPRKSRIHCVFPSVVLEHQFYSAEGLLTLPVRLVTPCERLRVSHGVMSLQIRLRIGSRPM